jgi:hypothetical protein
MGQDRQDRTDKLDSRNYTDRPEHDSKDRIAGTGQLGRDNRDRTMMTGQSDRTVGTGH